MEIPMDIPNLCSKTANSDLNSDLDCSDVDFDSDSQNKPTAPDADEKTATQKRDEACEKLKKIFLARVSTDSTETDCSFEFKPQTAIIESSSHLTDNKLNLTMECEKTDGFCIVQNVVSSTDDIEIAKEHVSLSDHETIDIITKCVPTDECLSVTVANVIDAHISLETGSNEHTT